MYHNDWRLSKIRKITPATSYEKELPVSFYSTLVTSSELTLASSFPKRRSIRFIRSIRSDPRHNGPRFLVCRLSLADEPRRMAIPRTFGGEQCILHSIKARILRNSAKHLARSRQARQILLFHNLNRFRPNHRILEHPTQRNSAAILHTGL